MIEASVITPVWNQSRTTLSFLYHNWKLYHNNPAVEFIVIDNGSTDNTGQVLDTWQDTMDGRLEIIHNTENLGFGPANNQGAEIARGDALCFISNDVTPTGDYISPILASLQRRPDDLHGAQLFEHDTGWNSFYGQVVKYMAGWAVFCTKAAFDGLGGWDERYYPCDYEDMDLSLTAVQQDRRLVVMSLPLIHRFGVSAAYLPGGRESHTVLNRERFTEKWKGVLIETRELKEHE